MSADVALTPCGVTCSRRIEGRASALEALILVSSHLGWRRLHLVGIARLRQAQPKKKSVTAAPDSHLVWVSPNIKWAKTIALVPGLPEY